MKYKANHAGVAKLLVGDDMRDAMDAYAEAGAEHAASIAPIGSGDFASSFSSGADIDEGRATGIVASVDPDALSKEFGTSNQAGHHTLARTADWLEAIE